MRLIDWKTCTVMLGLMAAAGGLGAMRGVRSGQEVAWTDSLKETDSRASLPKRSILISLVNSQDGICQKMQDETFSDPEVVAITRHYRCVRLDCSDNARLLARFHTKSLPVTILTDVDGKEQLRVTGYVAPDRLARILQDR